MREIMLIMIYIFLSVGIVSAGTVDYCTLNGQCASVVFNDKYSLRDFTKKNFLNATDLEGAVIYASSFSQENPDTRVFPESVQKMTFYNCNLDNVRMNKPGWIVVGGTERRYKVQNDLKDWEVDANGKPVKVLNEEHWIKQGYSVDPAKIPLTKLERIEDGPKTSTAVIE